MFAEEKNTWGDVETIFVDNREVDMISFKVDAVFRLEEDKLGFELMLILKLENWEPVE